MKALIPLCCALLSGCIVYSPKQVMESEPFVITLRQAPAQAAACFARTLEAASPYALNEIRALDDKGGMEMLTRLSTEPGLTVLVVHFTPAETGSQARIWPGQSPMNPTDPTVKAVLGKC